jgi:GMP synthase (glutamine-hydrolysing)
MPVSSSFLAAKEWRHLYTVFFSEEQERALVPTGLPGPFCLIKVEIMRRPILILQHFWCETPGIFLDVLNEHGIPTGTVRGFMGETYPADLSAYSGVVVMGGPMGVYEENRYPWLRQEDALLKTAIQQDLPTLGVCLGSQLIAKAAGAEVKPGPHKEIGWYPLTLSLEAQQDPLWRSFPATFEAFEWHGDIFSLPPGAVSLASSELYPHQAFRLGQRVYALLFHLEVTAAMAKTMLDTFADEVASVRAYIDPAAIEYDLAFRAARLNNLARDFMRGFCEMFLLR